MDVVHTPMLTEDPPMTSEPSIHVFEVMTRDLDGLTDARGQLSLIHI